MRFAILSAFLFTALAASAAEVNWGKSQPPDLFGSAQSGFEMGQHMRRQAAAEQAEAQYVPQEMAGDQKWVPVSAKNGFPAICGWIITNEQVTATMSDKARRELNAVCHDAQLYRGL